MKDWKMTDRGSRRYMKVEYSSGKVGWCHRREIVDKKGRTVCSLDATTTETGEPQAMDGWDDNATLGTLLENARLIEQAPEMARIISHMRYYFSLVQEARDRPQYSHWALEKAEKARTAAWNRIEDALAEFDKNKQAGDCIDESAPRNPAEAKDNSDEED